MPPRKPAKTDDSDPRVLSSRVLVNITRDQTSSTPRVVWLHEIPVLEAMFGEGNVKHIDPALLDEGFSAKPSADLLPFNKKQDALLPPSMTQGLGFVFIGDKGTEFQRMADAYGMHPEIKESMVEHVYGRLATGRFSALLGSPTMADLPDAQVRELCAAYGASGEDLAAAKTTEELHSLAEALGVEVGD